MEIQKCFLWQRIPSTKKQKLTRTGLEKEDEQRAWKSGPSKLPQVLGQVDMINFLSLQRKSGKSLDIISQTRYFCVFSCFLQCCMLIHLPLKERSTMSIPVNHLVRACEPEAHKILVGLVIFSLMSLAGLINFLKQIFFSDFFLKFANSPFAVVYIWNTTKQYTLLYTGYFRNL